MTEHLRESMCREAKFQWQRRKRQRKSLADCSFKILVSEGQKGGGLKEGCQQMRRPCVQVPKGRDQAGGESVAAPWGIQRRQRAG